jgi:hypothetical protein
MAIKAPTSHRAAPIPDAAPIRVAISAAPRTISTAASFIGPTLGWPDKPKKPSALRVALCHSPWRLISIPVRLVVGPAWLRHAKHTAARRLGLPSRAVDQPSSSSRDRLIVSALRLSALSVVWGVLAGGVSLTVGLLNGSLGVIGLGLNVLADVAGSAALLWRFRAELHHDTAASTPRLAPPWSSWSRSP